MQNLIKQKSVGKSLKHCFNACNEFLNITTTGHILSAALKAFGMATLDSQPSEGIIPCPEDAWTQIDNERQNREVEQKCCGEIHQPFLQLDSFLKWGSCT